MSDEKKQSSKRPYLVKQDNGNGNITQRLVIANTQAQARGHVTRKTIHVEAVNGLAVAELIAAGVAVEHASESPPEQAEIEGM